MAAFNPKLPQKNPSRKQGRLCKIGAFFGTSNYKILELTCMSIYPSNLAHSFLAIYTISIVKIKKSFFLVLKTYNSVLKAKKTIFWSRYGVKDFKFLFLGELGTCLPNLIPMRHMEPWGRCHFPQRGMLKFTYRGRFLKIKRAYEKL